jgi:dsDNA-specific endonuclease/ATPase MutS2
MAERQTIKDLSKELESLRSQLREMELRFESKLEKALEKAAEKLKSRVEASRTRADTTPAHGAGMDTSERQRMIAETAYFRAEQRGFSSSDPEKDWKEAEIEVDRMLLEGKPKKPVTRGRKAATRKARPGSSTTA